MGWPSLPLGDSCPSENVFHVSQWMPSFLSLSPLFKNRFQVPFHNPLHPRALTLAFLLPVSIKAEAINQSDFMSAI